MCTIPCNMENSSKYSMCSSKNLNGKLYHQHDNGNSTGIISTFIDTKSKYYKYPCVARNGETKNCSGVEFGMWGEIL